MEEITTAQDIRNVAYSFRESRVLLTAFELKIFTVLGEHSMSSEEIAKIIEADIRATDRLMNALCSMNLNEKIDGKFRNTNVSSKFLVEGKSEFMGGLYHTNHLWNSWNHLTDSVKKGTTQLGDQNKKEKEDWVESFIAAMHYRGVNQAKQLSKMIDLSKTRKILDIGGGSAAFSMEFVKINPSIKAVVLDLPHVIPVTKRYVAQEGLTDNFNFIEGNYLTTELGDGYDLILLSAIVHINNYEQNKNLIMKCVDALNDNGIIIISDFVMNEDRLKPQHGTFFSLNMLVGTQSGDTYTEGEIKEWLIEAGFSKIERKNTGYTSDLIIGIK